ncbi:MAG: pyridoxal phosphate-dependent aminotransferase [Clostridia bacterium]|nr:pyridoxal phosphate-dependent aminotransferase [Clostridia bacterium]
MSLELSRVCGAISPSPTLAIDARAKEMSAAGRDVVSFCAGEPDFVTPQYIRTAAHEALDMGLTKYTPAAGTLELRRAICDKLLCDNALTYSPKQIVVSNGAKFAIYAALCAIINPGDEVLIPTPCWVSYPEMVRLAGGVPVFVPSTRENNYIVEARDMVPYVTDKTKALLINTPGNPTGSIWRREQLREIAKLAIARKFYVISDEIYEKLVYDGEQHTSIASFGDEIYNQTIVINGVSKAYAMTGWRIGYAAAPLPIAKIMSSLQSQVASGSNAIAQYACVEALTSFKGVTQVENMRQQYDRRRKMMVSRLNAIEGVTCNMPKGAFYCMMDITGLFGKYYGYTQVNNSMTFAELLLENADVAVVPGSAFCSEGFCRLSYATSMENIQRGLVRVAAFVDAMTDKPSELPHNLPADQQE